MKNSKLFLCILFVFCLVNVFNAERVNGQAAKAVLDSAIFQRPTEEYRILKIRKKRKFYVIYAERKDTLYKILSVKSKARFPKCQKIRCGNEYRMTLRSLFARYFGSQRLMPPGTTGRMGISYYGTLVALETQNDIWDLFEALELQGLYLVKEEGE